MGLPVDIHLTDRYNDDEDGLRIRRDKHMRSKALISVVCICLLLSLCSCTIKSDRKISEKVLSDRKAAYENYLKETYPDETFTVEVWQEYGEDIGPAGLPDYEGYLIRQVVTDSRGNRFQVFEVDGGKYSDDYQ
ncbi:MAG: hypothetical protein IJK38_13670, partial [Oscillospiraceae bacterium]|nr:hypothetical protein [Oscillospiraceae bacterium]